MEMNQAKTILVTGATGNQGGATARHLLTRGFSVRALTRNPDRAQAHLLARKGAQIVAGNLNDGASMEKALKGAYGVFSVQNFWEHGAVEEIKQGKGLIDAARMAGVSHFVYSSVASADRDTGLPHFESKRIIENHLRASGLNYTILRPVFFMENLYADRERIKLGRLSLALPPEARLQMIAVDDIGAMAALAFAEPENFLGRTLEIAGAEMTLPQLAQILSETIGREVTTEEIPLDALRKANPEMADMFAWLAGRGYEVDIPGLRAHYPWLKTFGEWVRSSGWEADNGHVDDQHEELSHSESPMRIE